MTTAGTCCLSPWQATGGRNKFPPNTVPLKKVGFFVREGDVPSPFPHLPSDVITEIVEDIYDKETFVSRSCPGQKCGGRVTA